MASSFFAAVWSSALAATTLGSAFTKGLRSKRPLTGARVVGSTSDVASISVGSAFTARPSMTSLTVWTALTFGPIQGSTRTADQCRPWVLACAAAACFCMDLSVTLAP
jgi:hypothetical protein